MFKDIFRGLFSEGNHDRVEMDGNSSRSVDGSHGRGMDGSHGRDMDGNDNTSAKNTQQKAPAYVLSRELTTVDEVWREWDEGLYRGTPAVRDLEKRYQATWRSSVKGRP